MKNLILIASLFLVGCTTTTNTYVYVPRPKAVEPVTQPVTMKQVKWQVLNKEELKKKLQELEAKPDPNFTLFAVTPEGFKNLNSNLIEINRFMQEQQEVIVYYRKYIEETSILENSKSKKQ